MLKGVEPSAFNSDPHCSRVRKGGRACVSGSEQKKPGAYGDRSQSRRNANRCTVTTITHRVKKNRVVGKEIGESTPRRVIPR